MKVTLDVSADGDGDITRKEKKNFDFTFDAIKALLHSAEKGWAKKIPQSYQIGNEINHEDLKSGFRYQFKLTKEWMEAYKAVDYFTKENCDALEKALLSVNTLKTRCDEAFKLYSSWYRSGGAERQRSIEKIQDKFLQLDEKKDDTPDKLHEMLSLMIEERNSAYTQHTSQWTYKNLPFLFNNEKPKFAMALDPLIMEYQKLLKVKPEFIVQEELKPESNEISPPLTPKAL